PWFKSPLHSKRASGSKLLLAFTLPKAEERNQESCLPLPSESIPPHVIKDYKEIYSVLLSRANQTLQQVGPRGRAGGRAALDGTGAREAAPMGLLLSDVYLDYSRIPHTDPPEFEFKWGPRAAKETSKQQILRFVAKIQNKYPQTWMSQYNEAEAEALGSLGACDEEQL
uniref:MAGE domain-containing protein n=1 Tax=Sphenodon punctatus TaxID=8508 RepID=A0A8D0HQ22_SPHPU